MTGLKINLKINAIFVSSMLITHSKGQSRRKTPQKKFFLANAFFLEITPFFVSSMLIIHMRANFKRFGG